MRFSFGALLVFLITVIGARTRADFGSALNFDGASSFVAAPAIDFSSSNVMTLEAWIQPINLTSTIYSEIIRQQSPNNYPDFLLSFQNTGTVLAFGLKCAGNYQELHVNIDPATFVDGKWHHLAATYNGTNQRLYHNGTLLGSLPQTGKVDFTAVTNSIGAAVWQGPEEFFNGTIDEVRLWRVARSATDIANHLLVPLTGAESGLAAYYAFNEAAGSIVGDASLHGNTGGGFNNLIWVDSTVPNRDVPQAASGSATAIVSNGATLNGTGFPFGSETIAYFEYSTNRAYGQQTASVSLGHGSSGVPIVAAITGLVSGVGYHWRAVAIAGGATNHGVDRVFVTTGTVGGYALNLDGASSWVSIPVLDFSATNKLTLEAWIKPANITNSPFYDILRQQGAAYYPDWLLGFQAGGFLLTFGLQTTNGAYVELRAPINPQAFTDGQWHQVAAVYDGATMFLYADAILIGTTNQTGTVAFTGTGNGIGAWPRGALGEFFNGMIDEVRFWQGARTPSDMDADGFHTLTGLEKGLAAYYRLDDGAGRIATDSSTNGRNGTLVNTSDWRVSTVPSFYPPLATSLAATGFNTNSAILNGSVYLRGSAGSAYFEYGPDASYGTQTPLTSIGAGSGFTNVAAAISGLIPGHPYHYRVNAVDARGTYHGFDKILFTPAATAGAALTLDGAKSCISTPAIDVRPNSAFSVEAWIKPNNLTNTETSIIFQQKGAFDPDFILGFENHGRILVFGMRVFRDYEETQVIVDPRDFTNGGWHHVAGVYDGGSKRIYIDGMLAGSTPQAGPPSFTASLLSIGGSLVPGPSEFLNGLIDEVRIWTIGLTPAQVAQRLDHELMGTEPGLAAYYRLNEGTGTVATDASTNHHTGALFDNPAWVNSTAPVHALPAVFTQSAVVTSPSSAVLGATVLPAGLPAGVYWSYGPTTNYGFTSGTQLVDSTTASGAISNLVAGLTPATLYHYRAASSNSSFTLFGADKTFFSAGVTAGSALSLDGTSGYATASAIALGGGASNALTFEVWIKPVDLAGASNATILRQGAVSNTDWFLGFANQGANLVFGLRTGAGYQELRLPVNAADYADGNWHHLAASYDNTTQRLFRDGILLGSLPQTGPVIFPAATLTIGASASAAGWTDFFNGQIDESRVWSVARTAGDIGYYLNRALTGSEPGLLACLHFDDAAGTTASDASGNGHNATLVAGAAWVTSTSPLLALPVGLTGFSPATGMTGASVTLTGTNLLAVTGVLFNGINAAFVVQANSSVTAIVPPGAATGPITVMNSFNSMLTSSNFLVDNLAPTLSVIAPRDGSFVTNLTSLKVAAADEPGGSGLASVGFFLQRGSDFEFWNGTRWGLPVLLPAQKAGGFWIKTNGLPLGQNFLDGAYTIYAEAFDAVGNSATVNVGVTADGFLPVVPMVFSASNATVRFPGVPFQVYRIQASTNLIHWDDVGSVPATPDGIVLFNDGGTAALPNRFYRTVKP